MGNKLWLIAGGVFVSLFAFRKLIMEQVSDYISAQRIKDLHPDIRKKAIEFLNQAQKSGIKLRITSGLRTCEEQNALYAQGRTKPGKIVTNARCNESLHNFGLAIDVVEIKGNKAIWENPNWNKIGKIGKSVGFAWGGDWKGDLVDRPHFEMTFGKTLAQIQKLPEFGGYVRFS